MGDISKRLHRKLTKLAPPGVKGDPPKGWRPKEPAPDMPKLIADGYDPIHAAYIFVHHITSVFSENVSRLPEMRTYAKEVGSAEGEYMPSGPPMSPLTMSFFSCWAFFDHRIGTTTDTLAGCLIDANDTIYVADSESTAQVHPGWQRGIRIGSLKDGKVTTFIPPHKTDNADGAMGEGIAVDAAGNIYTAEANLRGVTKYVKN